MTKIYIEFLIGLLIVYGLLHEDLFIEFEYVMWEYTKKQIKRAHRQFKEMLENGKKHISKII